MSKYVPWYPFKQTQDVYYCEGLREDYEGFRILIRGEGRSAPMLRLLWDVDSVLYYNRIEESSALSPDWNRDEMEFPHPFYTVEHSKLLEWFHEISSHVREGSTLKHYAILLANDYYDVIAYEDPIAENLN